MSVDSDVIGREKTKLSGPIGVYTFEVMPADDLIPLESLMLLS